MPLKFTEPPQPPHGAPEWMVTYADMVTLLLTLFVMLVSLSEINREGPYQDVVESMQNRFGQGAEPGQKKGNLRPRNNAMAAIAVGARALREASFQPSLAGGDSAAGAEVRTLLSSIGFSGETQGLSAESREQLAAVVARITGKAGTVELRSSASTDGLALAVARAQACKSQLLALGLDAKSVKISVAEEEPMAESAAAEPVGQQGARVELYLLESQGPARN